MSARQRVMDNMTIINKKPQGAVTPRGSNKPTDISELVANTIEQKSKRHTILFALSLGMSLTRFTAEHLRDHCLNTTISEIGRHDGIIVSRKDISFFNSVGHKVHCKLYWLAPDQQEKALKFLGTAR